MRYHKKSAKRLSLRAPRTPISAYRYAVTYRNIITTAIIILAIVVAVAVFCAILLNPERQIPRKFEALASNYYENIFYTGMINSDSFDGDLKAALQKHEAAGLAPVSLRQLIYLSDGAAASDGNYLAEYCDINDSSVIFYPESPYTKSSYHFRITYACNF